MRAVTDWKKYWDSKIESDPIAKCDYYVNNKAITRDEYVRLILAPNIALLSLNSHSNFLEIGCGTGVHLLEVESIVDGFVAGTDLSETLLSCYKGRAVVKQAEAINQPFEDSSFDRILMVGVTMYFPDIEYFRKSLHEIIRLLKTDGMAVISDLLLGPQPLNSIYRHFSWNEIIDLLGEFDINWSLQNQNAEKRKINRRFNLIIKKECD